ncbi:MAG: S8 family peptidase [Burkholderiales bacterium]
MKTAFSRLTLSVLAVVSLCAAAALPGAGIERGPKRTSFASAAEPDARVIVKFRADAAPRALALSSRLGLSLTDGRSLGPRTQVLKGRGLASRELAERLSAQADVEYAVVDGRMRALVVPNDPLYVSGQTGSVPPAGQWYLRAPTSTAITDSSSIVSAINAEGAWAITNGSSSVVVADLDTGVRFDHPDLTSKLLPGYDFIRDAATGNDGDSGRDADASDPGDFVTSADVGVVAGCTSADIGNSSWHGTETAGLIGAATNNGAGIASVGRNVRVLPLRVLGKCGGYDSDIQAAMKWAVGMHIDGVPDNATPAKVLNMSLGSDGACSAAYGDAIAQVNAAGAVVVIASGNSGLAVGTPANCPGAIAVAGVRQSGSKVGYSDLGPTIAIAAPAGNCVNNTGACLYPLMSTTNSGTTTPVLGAAGGTYTGSGSNATLGTSFSTPLVAGTAALLYSANPALTPTQVLAALKSSARPFPATGFDPTVGTCTAPGSTAQSIECYCTTSTCGAGLLDAGAATAAAAATHASVSASATTVTTGATVTLDGSGSWPSGGASANLTYQWAITSGAASASLTSSTSSVATLSTSAAGNVVVALTITDSAGQQANSSVTLVVNAVPTAAGDSGGGGAMQLGWLLGWLASVIGVWVVTPRQRRA